MFFQALPRSCRWSLLGAAAIAITSLTALGQTSTSTILKSLGQTATTTSAPCSSGVAYFEDTQDVITVASPFSVLFHASTAKGCTLTTVRLYVDNKAYRTYKVNQPSGTLGGSNFPNVSLPTGYHTFVGVAWNNAGYAFATQSLRAFVADQDSTVYVNSPANGAIVTGPTVNVDVRVRWSSYDEPPNSTQITRVRVYVDNVLFFDSYNSGLTYANFSAGLSSGPHHLVAVAWNYQGKYIEESSTFTVK